MGCCFWVTTRGRGEVFITRWLHSQPNLNVITLVLYVYSPYTSQGQCFFSVLIARDSAKFKRLPRAMYRLWGIICVVLVPQGGGQRFLRVLLSANLCAPTRSRARLCCCLWCFPRFLRLIYSHLVIPCIRQQGMRAIQARSYGMSLSWRISCKSIFGETASQISSVISRGKEVFAKRQTLN